MRTTASATTDMGRLDHHDSTLSQEVYDLMRLKRRSEKTAVLAEMQVVEELRTCVMAPGAQGLRILI
jgi:hypothetical protein